MAQPIATDGARPRRKPFYMDMSVQVFAGMLLGAVIDRLEAHLESLGAEVEAVRAESATAADALAADVRAALALLTEAAPAFGNADALAQLWVFLVATLVGGLLALSVQLLLVAGILGVRGEVVVLAHVILCVGVGDVRGPPVSVWGHERPVAGQVNRPASRHLSESFSSSTISASTTVSPSSPALSVGACSEVWASCWAAA